MFVFLYGRLYDEEVCLLFLLLLIVVVIITITTIIIIVIIKLPWRLDDDEVRHLVLIEGGEHVQVFWREFRLVIDMIKKIIDDDVDNGDDDGDGDDDEDIDDHGDNTDDDNDGVDDHPEYLTTLNNAHRSCFYVEIPEKIIEWFFDRMHASYSKVSYEIDHYTEKKTA